jgi:hypothetical protein
MKPKRYWSAVASWRSMEAKGQRTGLVLVTSLSPAVLGAALNWPGRITVALVVPSVILYLLTDGARYYREVTASASQPTLAESLPLLYMVPALVLATVFSSRFSGLFVAAGLVFVELWAGGLSKKRAKPDSSSVPLTPGSERR